MDSCGGAAIVPASSPAMKAATDCTTPQNRRTIIRRGQSRKAATEARKNSGTLLGSSITKGILVLVAALTMFLAVPWDSFGADETTAANPTTATATTDTTAQTAEQNAQTREWYRVAVKYRAKAHMNYHRIGLPGHLAGTHGKLPYSGKLEYEKARALVWKKRAELWFKKHQAHVAALKPCTKAGFPGWYCPILKKAAVAEGKPRWYSDSNLAWLIHHESGFRPCVRNGGVIDCGYTGNRAWGLFQFLGSTWAGTGIAQTSDPYWQTRAGIRYIKNRYHTPAGAVSFWRANHWY